MTIPQRFCPICDRSFEKNEAVLRCNGCGVMHHPGCWVTNNGCATQGRHDASPAALAYGSEEPPARPDASPAEGTRVAAPPPPPVLQPRAKPITPADAPEPVIGAAADDGGDAEPVIGGSEPVRLGSGPPPAPPVMPPRRQIPYAAASSSPGQRAMPKIYPGHRILQFWYVPVAAFLAIGVALGVVWASDQLFGDDAPPVAPVATQTPEGEDPGGGNGTPDPDGTETAAGDETPGTGNGDGELAVGDEAVVVGTDPECLNVRVSPGTANEPVTCIPDGTEVVVLAGPSEVDNLTWMKIRAPSGEGWAATEYLEKR